MNFTIEELDKTDESNVTMEELMKQLDQQEADNAYPYIVNYHENFTVKELQLICEYYGLKTTKKNKAQLVDELVFFESDLLNEEIVSRRKTLWFYMDEVKNDKFMKKFVLW